ncbi:MAG: T9SS type A sorting domain-containing protein [Crocinitomicaceae bacterium]|nr:T9SS type A sorting domain-containing protein [Crocinitomicaceae bacterium]
MKRLLLIALVLPTIGYSQITTTGSGDYYNPLMWDCFCIPTAGEDMIINHDMTATIGVLVDGGSVLINTGASLTVNPGGTGVWVTNGATFTNNGAFNLEDATFSQGTTVTSTGTIDGDSLLNQGVFINSGTSTIYDFANDEVADFTNTGLMQIGHNFNNQGLVTNEDVITVGYDCSNCNTQVLDAMFINNGTMCVTNDFANCPGDTLSGTGEYYIGGLSANNGVFTGTFDYFTLSGTFLNLGVIEPTVNIATGVGSCFLGLSEEESVNLVVYPNPTTGALKLNVEDVNGAISVKVLNVLGQIISEDSFESSNEIDLKIEGIAGMYILEINTEDGKTARINVIKK